MEWSTDKIRDGRSTQTIFWHDCRKVLPEIETHLFDACITDPPYRIENWDAFGSSEKFCYGQEPLEYREWLPEVKRVLKPEGTLFVYEHPNNLPELLDALRGLGFHFKRSIIWYCPNRQQEWNVPGFPLNKHDICVYATRSRNGFKWNTMGKGALKDVLRFPVVREGPVPGSKPLKMVETLMKTCTDEGDFVLDPFLGWGTTLLAARQLGRNGVGFEIRQELREKVLTRLHAGVSDLQKFHIEGPLSHVWSDGSKRGSKEGGDGWF